MGMVGWLGFNDAYNKIRPFLIAPLK